MRISCMTQAQFDSLQRAYESTWDRDYNRQLEEYEGSQDIAPNCNVFGDREAMKYACQRCRNRICG
jgi:hypothetical protein